MRRSVARWNAAFMRQKGCQKKFVLRPLRRIAADEACRESGLRYFEKQKLSMSFPKNFVLFGSALLIGVSIVVSCGRNSPSSNPQSQTSARTNQPVSSPGGLLARPERNESQTSGRTNYQV